MLALTWIILGVVILFVLLIAVVMFMDGFEKGLRGERIVRKKSKFSHLNPDANFIKRMHDADSIENAIYCNNLYGMMDDDK